MVLLSPLVSTQFVVVATSVTDFNGIGSTGSIPVSGTIPLLFRLLKILDRTFGSIPCITAGLSLGATEDECGLFVD